MGIRGARIYGFGIFDHGVGAAHAYAIFDAEQAGTSNTRFLLQNLDAVIAETLLDTLAV